MTRVAQEIQVNIGLTPLENYRRGGTLVLTHISGYRHPRLTLEFEHDPRPIQENGKARTYGDGSYRYVARCRGFVNRRLVGRFNLVQSEQQPRSTLLQVLN